MKAAIDRPLPSYPAALAGTGRPALWLPLLLLPTLWASPAAASPAGPSSSATVRVILSVAPRIDLKPLGRPDGAASAEYCIGGNIGRTSLPVRLLWPSSGESGGAGPPALAWQGAEVPWCGSEEAKHGLPAARERTGLALISPE
jgi:hypothetical protein